MTRGSATRPTRRGREGMARVSIVITTYQRGATIARAIDSAIGQSYPVAEVVVVDDGSTDDTTHILADYDQVPGLRITRHPRNLGATAAKNTGLDMVDDSCDLVGLLDSDDVLLPHAIERMVAADASGDGPYSMVLGWGRDSTTGARTGRMGHLDADEGLVTLTDALAGDFAGDFWVLVRRDVLGQHRFEPRARGAEGSVWWRLLRDRPAWLIPDVVLDVDTSGSDRLTVVDYSQETSSGMMWAQRAMLEAVGADARRFDKRVYGEWHLELAKWAALAGDMPTAQRSARVAIRMAPGPRSILMALLSLLPSPATRGAALVRQRLHRRLA